MEEDSNWSTTVKCSMCDKIPETLPLFQCPIEHQYCRDCFFKLRESYNGSILNEATCVVCKATGIFTRSKINSDFLEKIKARPGIGRPYRYDVNEIASNGSEHLRPSTTSLPKQGNTPNITVETLFGLPSEEVKLLLASKIKTPEAVPKNEPHCSSHGSTLCLSSKSNPYHIPSQQSKLPTKCPHGPCKKVITTSSLISHFKHDHSDIPTHDIRRDRELSLTLNVMIIEDNNNICLGMITVYERNNIDMRKLQNSQNVVNAFKQYIPVDSFWLMVTGSIIGKTPSHHDLVIVWLFCPREEPFYCTIELCSQSGSTAFSTYCEVHSNAHNFEFEEIASGLHGLMINTASIAALLEDGPEINLNLTIH